MISKYKWVWRIEKQNFPSLRYIYIYIYIKQKCKIGDLKEKVTKTVHQVKCWSIFTKSKRNIKEIKNERSIRRSLQEDIFIREDNRIMIPPLPMLKHIN